MKKVFTIFASVLLVALSIWVVGVNFFHPAGAKAAPTCTATGFMRDNINLTAAMIPTNLNPNVTGSVNAAGCNIGVYYGPGITGTVTAQVFGANYYGVVNNGSHVTVTGSQIHDIGENPLNGDQHGYGIYFTEDTGAKGTITKNLVWNYQKNGIVVRGLGSNATISNNTVIGQGPVNYIAENGIEVGQGAKATISHNIVVGNSYTGNSGGATGSGILIYGGSCYGVALTTGVHITNNTIIGNDLGVALSNLDGNTCIPTFTPTNIVVKNNISTNDGINNLFGVNLSNQSGGYQAGVSDQGDGDQIITNSICGLGYTPTTPPPYLYLIDTTVTNSPTVTGNTSCLDGSPITAPIKGTLHVHAGKRPGVSI